MIAPSSEMRVYVATQPVDFRKGIDGLALVVQEMLGQDPFSGAIFVFRAKRADRLKILAWDRTGMVLVHKRLDAGGFVWPAVRDGVMRMSAAQFAALFEGLDWRLVRPVAVRRLLKVCLAEVEAALADAQEAQRRLEDILGQMQRERFGKRSEKLSPDQFNLPLEDVELAQGILEAAQEKAEAALRGKSGAASTSRTRNRGHLPAHLPRVERVIEPASTQCPCGCGEMARIGEDVSERLDVIPAQFRILVTRRPKYACRRCSEAVAQAHAPEHVVPGGLPTERLIAQVMVSKFGDHTPFYRQAQIYERQGISLDRGTLGNWTGRACFHLMPVFERLRDHLRQADWIFMDETRAPVLDPGRKKTKSGYFWAITADDRGHGGAGPPIVLFHYAPGRGSQHPQTFLAGYQGRFLQCDGYEAYNKLATLDREGGPWELVHCWTHVRRRFVKRMESGGSPIAEEALRQIALLYQVEKTVRGQPPEVRLAARQEHAAPIIAAFKPWLEAQLSRIPAKSQLAVDIAYTLKLWPGLTRFLKDGRLELDTNPVENQIRPIALTRKNALFAGHEVGRRTGRCSPPSSPPASWPTWTRSPTSSTSSAPSSTAISKAVSTT